MKLSSYRTSCCKAEFYKKGRADYRCVKCDKDVTLELVFLQELIENKKNETEGNN